MPKLFVLPHVPDAVAGDTALVRFSPWLLGRWCLAKKMGRPGVLPGSPGRKRPGGDLGAGGIKKDLLPGETSFDLEECIKFPRKEEEGVSEAGNERGH